MNPVAQRYLDNCYVMKLRLILSRKLLEQPNSLIDLEIIVLLLRKVVEGIAFCCLISAEIRLGQVPRQIRNNWNAEEIFQFLEQRSLLRLPDCARLTLHDEDKRSDSSNTWRLEIHGAKEEEVRRLISIYGQCHKFLHEFNPYAGMPLRDKNFEQQMADNYRHLRADHMWIWNRFWQHSVRLVDQMFFIDFQSDDPSVAPRAVRGDNFLSTEDFEFPPLPWRNVFPQQRRHCVCRCD